jgi:integrase
MSRRQLGSIRSLSATTHRLSVSLGRDPTTGKRARLDRTFHGGLRAAERELARMVLEVGGRPTGRDMTLASYLEDVYMPSLEPPKVRRKTAEGYKSKIKVHVIPRIGSAPLAQVTPYLIDKWTARMTAEGVGAQSARHAFVVLRTALRQAVRWRLLALDPTAGARSVAVPERQLTVLTADQANKYLDAVRGRNIEPAVVLALGAGLRRSEICAVQWSDVDLRAATVSITSGLHQTGKDVWAENPKSSRSRRIVSLPAWAVKALKPHRGLGAVVPMSPDALTRRYRSWVTDAKLKLPYLPLRDLRNTHATLALEAGVDIVSVSRRLGHASVEITDRRYLRPHRSADELAAAKIDSIRCAPSRAKRRVAPSRATSEAQEPIPTD